MREVDTYLEYDAEEDVADGLDDNFEVDGLRGILAPNVGLKVGDVS